MSGIIWLQVVSWVGRTALLQAPKVGRPFKKGNSQHQSSSKWLHFPFLMFNLVSYDCDIPRSIFKRILCTHHHWWPFLPLSAHGGCVANFGICGCLCSAGTSESTRGRGGGEKSLPSCHGWLWWLLSRAGKTLENSHGTQEWRFGSDHFIKCFFPYEFCRVLVQMTFPFSIARVICRVGEWCVIKHRPFNVHRQQQSIFEGKSMYMYIKVLFLISGSPFSPASFITKLQFVFVKCYFRTMRCLQRLTCLFFLKKNISGTIMGDGWKKSTVLGDWKPKDWH